MGGALVSAFLFCGVWWQRTYSNSLIMVCMHLKVLFVSLDLSYVHLPSLPMLIMVLWLLYRQRMPETYLN